MPEIARLSVVVDANVAAAASKLKAVDAQFAHTGASARKMDAAIVASSRRSNAAITSTGRTAKTQYVGTGAAATAAARSHDQVANAATRSGRSVSKGSAMAKSGMAGAGMQAGMMGNAYTAAAMGAGYAFAKTIQVTSKFDGAMRNVNSIAGLSEQKFQGLSNSVNEMARTTAQSPQTLAEGMYQLVSSGFSAGEALTVMKSSAVAATAGLTDAETATTAVAGVLNAYKLSAKDAAQVSDDLFQVVDKGVLSFSELASGIGPVLPFASKLGVGLKEVGAMVAQLTKEGVPAAESMTYTKGAMAQLIKPTEDLQKQYKKLGVSSGADLINKTGSFQESLEALYVSTGRNTQAFAKLFPDLRGMTAAFQVTGAGAKGAQQMLREFADTAGRTNEVFKEQSKSTPVKWKQTAADVQATAIVYGKQLTPALNATATGLSKVATAARSNTGKNIAKWAPTPLAIPNLVKQATAGVNAIKKVGDGARLGDVKGGYRIKVTGGSSAVLETTKVKRGLNSIPGITTAKIEINPPNPNLITKTRTELNRLAQPLSIRTTVSKKTGNAATVVSQPKPIKIEANTDAAEQQAKRFVEGVNGLRARPRVTAKSNSATVKTQTLQDLASVNGKTATATVNVNYRTNGKPKGLASGGPVTTAMSEVNERGPESITDKAGRTAMLGDGTRQIMPLPIGWHVNTASETKRMGVGSYAKGGKVSKKRRARAERLGQRRLERLDFMNATGRMDDKAEAEKLKAIAGIKHLPTATKRDAQQRLYELQNGRRSAIGDAKNAGKQIGLDPAAAAKVAQDMAKRHVQEAKRSKDSEALARAETELKQSTLDLKAAQDQMAVSNLDAGVALAKLTAGTGDDLAAYGAQRDYWTQKLYELQNDAISDNTQGQSIAEAANGISAATDAMQSIAADVSASNKDLVEAIDRMTKMAEKSLPIQKAQFDKWMTDNVAAFGGARYGQRGQTAVKRQGAYVVR